MLRISALTGSYGRAPVLESVTLEVAAGEVCAILGSNGAGKSTLLRAITGLVPAVSADVLECAGQTLARRATYSLARRGIAYVPEGRGILNSLTVLENLQLGVALLKKRQPSCDADAQIEAVFERFPALRSRASISAGLLSGGQQQMLAIARALLPQPSVLLLDEPSLGLAPLIRREVAALLRDVADTERCAVLLAEQDITLAQRCADRAYVLRHGEIVAELEGDALHDRERLRQLYLGAAAHAARAA